MKFDMVLTTCPFCGTGCNFYLKVLGGEITDVVPCKTHPVSEGELCVLGRNAYKFIQNKNRLTKPLIRKGDDFIEVSWSEWQMASLESKKTLVRMLLQYCRVQNAPMKKTTL